MRRSWIEGGGRRAWLRSTLRRLRAISVFLDVVYHHLALDGPATPGPSGKESATGEWPGRAAQTELAYSRSPWLWAPAQRLDRKQLAPVLVVFNAAMVACGICHQRVWGRGERQLAWRCAGHQTYSRYFRQSARGGIPALAVQRRDGCARFRPSARAVKVRAVASLGGREAPGAFT